MAGAKGMGLSGRRVVVTRAVHQAEELARPLQALGAEVLLCPMLEIYPMRDAEPLRQALVTEFAQYNLAIATSVNGALAIGQFCAAEGIAVPLAGGPHFLGIGLATAKALARVVRDVSFVEGVKNARDLLPRVANAVRGKRVLLLQGETADAELRDGLFQAGAHVTAVQVYRMGMPENAEQNMRELLAGPPVDAVTFASGLTAQNFFYTLYRCGLAPGPSERGAVGSGLPRGAVYAAIGTVTERVMTKLGHPPQVVAQRPTMDALAVALAEFFRSRG